VPAQKSSEKETSRGGWEKLNKFVLLLVRCYFREPDLEKAIPSGRGALRDEDLTGSESGKKRIRNGNDTGKRGKVKSQKEMSPRSLLLQRGTDGMLGPY